jgi:hypothetical protein
MLLTPGAVQYSTTIPTGSGVLRCWELEQGADRRKQAANATRLAKNLINCKFGAKVAKEEYSDDLRLWRTMNIVAVGGAERLAVGIKCNGRPPIESIQGLKVYCKMVIEEHILVPIARRDK